MAGGWCYFGPRTDSYSWLGGRGGGTLRNTDEMRGKVLASNVGSILYYTRREECDGEIGPRIDLYLNLLVISVSVNVFFVGCRFEAALVVYSLI